MSRKQKKGAEEKLKLVREYLETCMLSLDKLVLSMLYCNIKLAATNELRPFLL